MNWISKQYPNRGLWQEEGGDYDIFVDDDGMFFGAYLCKALPHDKHPHLFDEGYPTLAAAKLACEMHQVYFSTA